MSFEENTLNAIIKYIIGDRSVEEFAKDVGVAKGTIYNILNAKNKKPISDKLLHAIYEHRCEGCDIGFESLIYANSNYQNTYFRSEREFARDCNMAIINNLLGRNYSIEKSSFETPYDTQFGSFYVDFSLDTSSNGNKFRWYFEVEKTQPSKSYKLDEHFFWLFLDNLWNEVQNGNRFSYVFENEEAYNYLKSVVESKHVKGYISIFLINTNNHSVISEYILDNETEL